MVHMHKYDRTMKISCLINVVNTTMESVVVSPTFVLTIMIVPHITRIITETLIQGSLFEISEKARRILWITGGFGNFLLFFFVFAIDSLNL